MFKNKVLVAFLLPLAVGLVGCGGSDGDNVNITNDFSPIDPPGPGPGPEPPVDGDCAKAVEVDFVSFNSDCSVGVLMGTISQDYILIRVPY